MATIRLIPSTYAVSSTSYLSVASASNMYTNTDSTTYATITNTNASTSSRYLYLRGFNFNSIPTGATINSFTVKIKGYESGLNTGTSYAPRLANGTSALGNTTASENFGTSTKTITIPTGSLTWEQISNTYGSSFTIMVYVRRNNRNTTGYFYCHGAEIEVDYTLPNVPVTGISLNQSTATIEEAETLTLVPTITPSDAANKNIIWSTNNSSIATVSNGIITGISSGTAIITVTTEDGGYTASCTVTVTPIVYTTYIQTDTLEDGKNYLIVNGNTGSVYIMSGEVGASAQSLAGISATISNGKLNLRHSITSRCLYTCEYETSGDSTTAFLKFGSNYLYDNGSSGLVVREWYSDMPGRHWHYKGENKHLLWFCNDESTTLQDKEGLGYNDTSTLNKYYLSIDSNGAWTGPYVRDTSLADTATPPVYLFTEETQSLHLKINDSWTKVSSIFKKINGSWVEQTDLTTVFDTNANYVKGN